MKTLKYKKYLFEYKNITDIVRIFKAKKIIKLNEILSKYLQYPIHVNKYIKYAHRTHIGFHGYNYLVETDRGYLYHLKGAEVCKENYDKLVIKKLIDERISELRLQHNNIITIITKDRKLYYQNYSNLLVHFANNVRSVHIFQKKVYIMKENNELTVYNIKEYIIDLPCISTRKNIKNLIICFDRWNATRTLNYIDTNNVLTITGHAKFLDVKKSKNYVIKNVKNLIMNGTHMIYVDMNKNVYSIGLFNKTRDPVEMGKMNKIVTCIYKMLIFNNDGKIVLYKLNEQLIMERKGELNFMKGTTILMNNINSLIEPNGNYYNYNRLSEKYELVNGIKIYRIFDSLFTRCIKLIREDKEEYSINILPYDIKKHFE